MKKNKKIIHIVLFSFALVLILSFFYLKFCSYPVSRTDNSDIKRIEVPTGTSIREIAKELKNDNLIRSSFVFYLAARYSIVKFIVTGDSDNFALKSGVYKISNNMRLNQIFEILSSGRQEFIRVSFPEGLTISKIASKLEKFGVCYIDEFKDATKNKDLLEEYNISSDSFEGYLFPDTYFFTPSMSGEAVVSLMVDNFFEKIKTLLSLKSLSSEKLNSIVVLASIIEREYRIDEEAPLIASVFYNRLNHNIGLYSCATVEYIITEIEGREHPDVITYADLAIDSPYNTYKWAGLPPGAISNPGLVALNAAINPEKTNYYFFRLIDPSVGRHSFTKDFSTHINEGYIINTKKFGN